MARGSGPRYGSSMRMPWHVSGGSRPSWNGTRTSQLWMSSSPRRASPMASCTGRAQGRRVLPLRELQAAFETALRGGPAASAAAEILGDGLAPEARLAIYRHHVFTTLTAALEAIYPVVCRLVHEQFFRYAADQYVRAYPPSGPCLFEYGNSFPTFLADVARLEWALNCATHAEESAALDGSALLRLPTEDLPRLTLRLQPSLALLSSPWPIDQIWHVNQPGADSDALVDLASGGVYLEVRQSEDDSVFRTLDPATHAFRDALSGGACLAEAADIAFEMDGVFDLPQALRNLFAEQLPVDYAVSEPSPEDA